MPDADTPLNRSLMIACEHVAWAKKVGLTPAIVLGMLGEVIPANESWDYVVGRLAEAWRCLR